MNRQNARIAFALTLFLTLAFQTSLGQQVAPEAPKVSKKSIAFVPYYHPRAACHPVGVKFVSLGGQPQQVLLAQVTIESFSDKPVSAVKIGWNVYKSDVGVRKSLSPCDVTSDAAEVLLSGTSPLIELGALLQNETVNIGTNPLKIPMPATKTFFVDQPFIVWDQFKSLTDDGTPKTLKDDYTVLLHVSEVNFSDGAKWEGNVK
jgi:hypothetical protein